MKMKLIGSFTSPYVRKVRLTLAEKKLEYQMVSDDPWKPTSVALESNPLGKVPCLVLEGGEALFDSRVIVEYLDTLSPVGKLIPGTGRERAEIKTWEALCDGILDAAIAVRLEATWAGRKDSERCQAWMNRYMERVHGGLAALEKGLGEKPYCMGINITLADLCLGSTLGWLEFRFPEIDWRSKHPQISRLFDKLKLRPSFIDTVPLESTAAASA